VSLSSTLKIIQELSENITSSCIRPAAKTKEELDLWNSDYEEYLKIKLLGVQPLSNNLKDQAELVLLQSQKFYSQLVELWHKSYFKDYLRFKLVQQKRVNEANQVRINDYSTLSYEEKLIDFFNAFEHVIDVINCKGEWFDLYSASGINGDGLVSNIDSLNLFVWQLPTADPLNKVSYLEMAKILTILFIAEKLSKKCSTSDMSDLKKLLSLYNHAKKGH
jgi:hypothetical protein